MYCTDELRVFYLVDSLNLKCLRFQFVEHNEFHLFPFRDTIAFFILKFVV